MGKTTLANKCVKWFDMEYEHFPSADLDAHMNSLLRDNVFFDRHFVGELVYPEIYGREPKMTFDDSLKIMRRIVDNNDLFIFMITSDLSIVKERLIERGELNYLEEIDQQNELFTKYAYIFDAWEYENFYICDIAQPNAYDKLDEWIKSKMNKLTINLAYKNVCRDLLEKGERIESDNTTRGSYTELNNYMFTIDDISKDVVDLKTRNISTNYLAGELLWYWSSSNKLDFINNFSKFWNKISDDGETSNSAYGYILRKKFGFDQIEKVIELLNKDPSSRRAVVNLNIPNENVIETKDEICTIALAFNIRHGKLNCTTMMRSNDVVFGLTYDLTYFISIQKYIADALGVEYGSYTHFAISMHVYDRDLELVKNIAYGNNDSMEEKLDVRALMINRQELSTYVKSEFTTREDFNDKLREKFILR